MAPNVENLVLEQLRPIREDMKTLNSKIDDLTLKTDGHTAILIGLGKYMHDIDGRVEHLETKLGA
jgi:hypothetical protein